MFRKYFGIQIENPCAENWENMLPAEQGRFCKSCSKHVVDFTSMNDAQIVSYFKHHENVCGRLHSGQLDRNLLPNTRKKSVFSKAIAAVVLLFQSFLAESQTLDIKPQSVIEQLPQTNKNVTPNCSRMIPGDSGSLTILISIEETNSLDPIQDAKVFINGDSIECLTNDIGLILIKLPIRLKDSSVNLKVTKDGYITYNHDIILDAYSYQIYMKKTDTEKEIIADYAVRIYSSTGICQINTQKDSTKDLYRKYPGLFREF